MVAVGCLLFQFQIYPAPVDVMNAETIITIVVIRIMRDGVRGVYERVVATTLTVEIVIVPVIVV